MVRRVVAVLCVAVFVFSLSGCATGRKQHEMEMQGLRNQVTVLESQLQSRDEEVARLNDALAKVNAEKEEAQTYAAKKRSVGEVKSRPNMKQIQIALANAGYNPGPIDGKAGRQTKEAIKAFQRAQGLPADGKVGKQTWALLKHHLYKKIK